MAGASSNSRKRSADEACLRDSEVSLLEPVSKKPRQVDPEIFRAVESGNADRLTELLKAGANVNSRNKEGLTILHVLAKGRPDWSSVLWKKMLEEVMQCGPDIYAEVTRGPWRGYTPLRMAAHMRQTPLNDGREVYEIIKAALPVLSPWTPPKYKSDSDSDSESESESEPDSDDDDELF